MPSSSTAKDIALAKADLDKVIRVGHHGNLRFVEFQDGTARILKTGSDHLDDKRQWRRRLYRVTCTIFWSIFGNIMHLKKSWNWWETLRFYFSTGFIFGGILTGMPFIFLTKDPHWLMIVIPMGIGEFLFSHMGFYFANSSFELDEVF